MDSMRSTAGAGWERWWSRARCRDCGSRSAICSQRTSDDAGSARSVHPCRSEGGAVMTFPRSRVSVANLFFLFALPLAAEDGWVLQGSFGAVESLETRLT